jgi:hypothetical protein
MTMMLCGIVLLSACSDLAFAAVPQRKVILFVWDGLRPDSVTPKTTPHLWKMWQRGVFFHKNHSTYPTFTMMNCSSFNTGDFPGKAGFYGNSLWLGPNTLKGKDKSGTDVDYNQPVFTEDWNILTSLELQSNLPTSPLFVQMLLPVSATFLGPIFRKLCSLFARHVEKLPA